MRLPCSFRTVSFVESQPILHGPLLGPTTSFLMVFVDDKPISNHTPSVFRTTKPGNQNRNLKSRESDRFLECYTAFYGVFVMPMAKQSCSGLFSTVSTPANLPAMDLWKVWSLLIRKSKPSSFKGGGDPEIFFWKKNLDFFLDIKIAVKFYRESIFRIFRAIWQLKLEEKLEFQKCQITSNFFQYLWRGEDF